MARSKRCLCTDCKPATEKSALELAMFAEISPPKSQPNKPHFENSSKMTKNDREDQGEIKKLNAKKLDVDALRTEVKELLNKPEFCKVVNQILAGNFSDFENLLGPDYKRVSDVNPLIGHKLATCAMFNK